ncbi:hypothetical protein COCMIDRAFT_79832 [Bipolaris oryzae ATCC 44560]|uniref:Uncharacterized protein n=1 Tax=Bipolaris oryzae ATCC 44560 TaxID=930090 RepID=W6ZHP0_COCMI|nr:uncharacterized protein COCMIDRAFT_79832 [Bipolaris oryzae ATCC 44560]EUC51372.1 hypothetical protein COCMIDRAFT_79832 [Bipolaris oryzae ATCC 44560]
MTQRHEHPQTLTSLSTRPTKTLDMSSEMRRDASRTVTRCGRLQLAPAPIRY